jgi:hypothetical protein
VVVLVVQHPSMVIRVAVALALSSGGRDGLTPTALFRSPSVRNLARARTEALLLSAISLLLAVTLVTMVVVVLAVVLALVTLARLVAVVVLTLAVEVEPLA